MEYLFLDLECSNGSDICSVGYVITDENFNVVEQNDVLINPESRFVLTNRAGTEGITLAYKKDEFYSAPAFPKRYDWLKSLIEQPDRMVVGFAVSNDAGFIKKACERYSLPYINFNFFDVQKLDAKIHNEGNIRGLSKILDFYDIRQDEENILHKSDDDAFFTMQTFVRMLGELNIGAREVIEQYADCCGESVDGAVSYNGHSIGSPDKMRRKDYCIFRSHCNTLKRENFGVSGPLSGKKICFCHNFESKNYRKMMVLAEKLYSRGARFVSLKYCNLFVLTGSPNSQSRIAEQNGAEIIDLSALLQMLDMDERSLEVFAGDFDIMPYKKMADRLVVPQNNCVKGAKK